MMRINRIAGSPEISLDRIRLRFEIIALRRIKSSVQMAKMLRDDRAFFRGARWPDEIRHSTRP